MNKFISKKNVFNRLMEDYRNHGKLIVAVDFDSTIYPYHVDDDCSYVQDLVRRLKPYSHIIIFTASPESRFDFITEYCKDNDIPFDYVNENVDAMKHNEGRKIYYNIILDDRGGLHECCGLLEAFLKEVEEENN